MGWFNNKTQDNGRGSSTWRLYGGTGSRTEQAALQRQAGVYAPGNRGQQADGLKPGDPGYYENRDRTYLWRDYQGGFDSLLGSYEGGQSSSQAIQQLLQNFTGSREELADFMETAGPLFSGLEAKRAEGSAGFQYMQDQGNWDLGALAGYGAAAGQVGQQTQRATRGAAGAATAAGLGRSTARSAVENMLRMQGGSTQANMFAQAQQQAAQNRMASAGNLFEAHRMIAQMALGQGITPRINSPQGGGMSAGQGAMQGAIGGATAGAALGPWGALGGAIVGGVGGYAASK